MEEGEIEEGYLSGQPVINTFFFLPSVLDHYSPPIPNTANGSSSKSSKLNNGFPKTLCCSAAFFECCEWGRGGVGITTRS